MYLELGWFYWFCLLPEKDGGVHGAWLCLQTNWTDYRNAVDVILNFANISSWLYLSAGNTILFNRLRVINIALRLCAWEY